MTKNNVIVSEPLASCFVWNNPFADVIRRMEISSEQFRSISIRLETRFGKEAGFARWKLESHTIHNSSFNELQRCIDECNARMQRLKTQFESFGRMRFSDQPLLVLEYCYPTGFATGNAHEGTTAAKSEDQRTWDDNRLPDGRDPWRHLDNICIIMQLAFCINDICETIHDKDLTLIIVMMLAVLSWFFIKGKKGE